MLKVSDMFEKKKFIGLKMNPEQRRHATESLGRAERHNKDAATRIERARNELARIMAPRPPR